MEETGKLEEAKAGGAFPQTRWTLVVRSKKDGTNPDHAEKALEELCSMYWTPLYAYLRRDGKSVEDAEDIVQDFINVLLQKDFFEKADRQQGKLRSFLLASLKNFAVDRYKFDSAEKRGGGSVRFSIDAEAEEGKLSIAQTTHLAPDEAYDQQWAISILEGALESVGQEYESLGKKEIYDQLSPLIAWNVRSRPQKEVARDLGLTDGAMRVALHRLRSKFRAAIREKVAETVAGGSQEIDEEIAELFAALS